MSTGMFFHIHHLTFSTTLNPDMVANVVSEYLNHDYHFINRGFYSYSTRYQFGDIGSVHFTDGRHECTVEIKGTGCELVGKDILLDLYQALEGKATRLDLAVDGCPFEPMKIKEHTGCGYGVEAQNVRTKVNRRGFKEFTEFASQGISIGSRQSMRFARIYNYRLDDEGKNITRFELELKKNAANRNLEKIISSSKEDFNSLVMGIIRDFIDFVEPGGDTNISRSNIATWWQDFIDGAERVSVKLVDTPVKLIKNTVKHVYNNAPSFVVAMNYEMTKHNITQEKFFELFTNHGFSGLKKKHKLLMSVMENPERHPQFLGA